MESVWLTWIVKIRFIVFFFLLGVELLIFNYTQNNVPTRLFVTVILVWYTVSVFFIVLVSVWEEYKLQAVTQIFTDLAFVTAAGGMSQGGRCFFTMIFFLLIVLRSLLLALALADLTGQGAFLL